MVFSMLNVYVMFFCLLMIFDGAECSICRIVCLCSLFLCADICCCFFSSQSIVVVLFGCGLLLVVSGGAFVLELIFADVVFWLWLCARIECVIKQISCDVVVLKW